MQLNANLFDQGCRAVNVQTIDFKFVSGGAAKLLGDALRVIGDPAGNGVLGTVFAGLINAPIAWDWSLALADITEGGFDGYARQAVTWSTEKTDPTGRPETISTALVWSPTGALTNTSIKAVSLHSLAAAGVLYGLAFLPVPISMASSADVLEAILRVSIPRNVNEWGQGSVLN